MQNPPNSFVGSVGQDPYVQTQQLLAQQKQP